MREASGPTTQWISEKWEQLCLTCVPASPPPTSRTALRPSLSCPAAYTQPRGWNLPALGSPPRRNRGAEPTPPIHDLQSESDTRASVVPLCTGPRRERGPGWERDRRLVPGAWSERRREAQPDGAASSRPTPTREGAPRPHDNATPHPPASLRSEPPAKRLFRPWVVPPQCPSGELLAGSSEGRAKLGSPTPRWCPPRVLVGWPAPGGRRGPTRIGCYPVTSRGSGKSASVSASRSHSAGSCGRSRGRPSAPGPRPRPAARPPAPPAGPRGRPPIPPSVRCEWSGAEVSDSRATAFPEPQSKSLRTHPTPHGVRSTRSRLVLERGMGELEDPAKNGVHAQRRPELQAKGLGEGGALERQGPIDHRGDVEEPPDGPRNKSQQGPACPPKPQARKNRCPV
ncbi:nascent polypeptide-associated complex subunit alpha, muscle-specific form-like [Phyllostomus discolor]|uniref:Nascent polypeptide-associated complex subunit alpha, muscle-specific form-like n=1 Tax=Phyllostomus discolor TaxID=89673 RepID=A0A6J2LSN3_9CHIR|nr:nascent polypeptide-associated complex subunit alpha, muscle-specific form-like [Phyllostomus discolor]